MRQETKPTAKAEEEINWRWEEWLQRMGKTPRFLKSEEMLPPERRSFTFRDGSED